jgi:hypothetical protein
MQKRVWAKPKVLKLLPSNSLLLGSLGFYGLCFCDFENQGLPLFNITVFANTITPLACIIYSIVYFNKVMSFCHKEQEIAKRHHFNKILHNLKGWNLLLQKYDKIHTIIYYT